MVFIQHPEVKGFQKRVLVLKHEENIDKLHRIWGQQPEIRSWNPFLWIFETPEQTQKITNMGSSTYKSTDQSLKQSYRTDCCS